jgi:predicted RNA binding protein YcfA (HicA-like mRNA interferase family)
MTSSELLRRLRRRGSRVISDRGKGGHVMLVLGERQTFVPTGGNKELHTGTLRKILRDLGLTPDDLK